MRQMVVARLVQALSFCVLVLGHPIQNSTVSPGATCPSDLFLCANGNCVHKRWVCDHEDDCGDMSDEGDCLAHTCQAHLFRCDNGRCMPLGFVCDLEDDCGDGSDERDCNGPCRRGQFTSIDGNSSICIPNSKRCNGVLDCPGGSDETSCPVKLSICSSDEFACSDSRTCIRKEWVCDGDNDCPGGEDEQSTSCSGRECSADPQCPEHRACRDFKCVDPCPGACGNNTACQVTDHIARCSCSPGFAGDPVLGCKPRCSDVYQNELNNTSKNSSFVPDIRSKKKFCFGTQRETQNKMTLPDMDTYYGLMPEWTLKFSWQHALAHCRSLDMELASITSQHEQDEVESLVSEYHGLSDSFWLAGSDKDVPGQFVWTTTGDYVGLTFSNWFSGEPSGDPAHCIEIRKDDFKWRSFECSFTQDFVCEYKVQRSK